MKRLVLMSIIAAIPIASSSQVFADEWVFCAKEHQTCNVPGTKMVRYGAGNGWTQMTATDQIHCGNNVFGDPAPGVHKACYYQQNHRRTHWEKCASEGQYCGFNGQREVKYGAGDSWSYVKTSNGVSCSNNVFGDPAYGTRKACYIKVY
jgi:hypothetical protein